MCLHTDADMVQQICVRDFQKFPGRFYDQVRALRQYIRQLHCSGTCTQTYANPAVRVTFATCRLHLVKACITRDWSDRASIRRSLFQPLVRSKDHQADHATACGA